MAQSYNFFFRHGTPHQHFFSFSIPDGADGAYSAESGHDGLFSYDALLRDSTYLL